MRTLEELRAISVPKSEMLIESTEPLIGLPQHVSIGHINLLLTLW